MKKVILIIAASLFTACLLIATEQSNPFDKFDKDMKKLEEKKAKSKDEKSKKNVDGDIKKIQEQKDKLLKKLTAPLEKEKEDLNADIDKAKAKDKNADLSAKQAKLDSIDKKIQYYNALSSGKTAEIPKEPGKTTTDKDKTGNATDKIQDKKTATPDGK